jgi:hypothetical protein
MQYVISMTSRMVTIAAGCVLLLCVLLFMLGVEIGARFVAPQAPEATDSTASAIPRSMPIMPAPATTPDPPAAASSPAAGETDAAPVPSTS